MGKKKTVQIQEQPKKKKDRKSKDGSSKKESGSSVVSSPSGSARRPSGERTLSTTSAPRSFSPEAKKSKGSSKSSASSKQHDKQKKHDKNESVRATGSADTPDASSGPVEKKDTGANGRFSGVELSSLTPSTVIFSLCSAAAIGDVNALKAISAQFGLEYVRNADYDRRTPLHLAAAEGQLEACEWLMENGVDMNAVDRFGRTPLDDAVRGLRDEVARSLHSHGARLLLSAGELAVRLNDLAWLNDVASLRRLVDLAHADVNVVDNDGRAPLHVAASRGNTEAVRYLLSAGADPLVVDGWGRSPVAHAALGGHTHIAEVLRRSKISEEAVAEVLALPHLRSVLSKALPVLCAVGGDDDTLASATTAAGRRNEALESGHGGWDYAEVLLSTEDNAACTFSDVWWSPTQLITRRHAIYRRSVSDRIVEAGDGMAGHCFAKQTPMALSEFPVQKPAAGGNDAAPSPRSDQCLESADLVRAMHMHRVALIPLVYYDQTVCVVQLFGSSTREVAQGELDQLVSTASRLIMGPLQSALQRQSLHDGQVIAADRAQQQQALIDSATSVSAAAAAAAASGSLSLSSRPNVTGMPAADRVLGPAQAAQLAEVYQLLLNEGVFNARHVYEETLWFYCGLGLDTYYFDHFEPSVIARHIHAFIAAKKLAQVTGEPEKIALSNEDSRDGFYLCPDTPEDTERLEKRIERDWLREGYEGPSQKPAGFKRVDLDAGGVSVRLERRQGVALRFFRSLGSASPDGTTRLCLYFLTRRPYIATRIDNDAADVWDVATGEFLRDKSAPILKIYGSLIERAVRSLAPVFELAPQPGSQKPDAEQQSLEGTTATSTMAGSGRKERSRINVAFRRGTTHSFFSSTSTLMRRFGVHCSRRYIETFANDVEVYTLYFLEPPEKVLPWMNSVQLLYALPRTSLSPLFHDGRLSFEAVCYAYAAWKFAFYFVHRPSEELNLLMSSLQSRGDTANLARIELLKQSLRREVFTENRVSESFFEYHELVEQLYEDFRLAHSPTLSETERRQSTLESQQELRANILKTVADEVDVEVFSAVLLFNRSVLRTNFYRRGKTALAFSLSPSFFSEREYPEQPYGLYMIIGSTFRGFHVRFRDVSRGGVRLIRSSNAGAYMRNVDTLFAENYNLAYTQQRKNKDIPEGGSKGTILLSLAHQDKGEFAFKVYVDALFSLILPNDEVVDYLGHQELLFLGPDEGTADHMNWGARYARTLGYRFWKAFTTGKSVDLGGIPHDLYGMTTRSVHQYVLGTLEKLGLQEKDVTKVQTGGPDGDLGSNEIKISFDNTVAIVDGDGVIYDPKGLNRKELGRLASKRLASSHFQTDLLSKQGFSVLCQDSDVKLPNGQHVESGLQFRNTFHLSDFFKSDIFVPCGGRPEAVNTGNVRQLIDADGQCRFKVIVEGANLFFTQDARKTLERAGCVLIKDASANKGGVTSSSLEVLAALAMTDDQFSKHMQIKDGVVPDFYERYVKEVQTRIEENARLEFDCLWQAAESDPSALRCELSDRLSLKINELNDKVQESTLWTNATIRRNVLARALPQTLQELLGGLNVVVERVPDNYIRAIFGAYLASHYVYKHGLHAESFEFFEFMENIQTD